jgi:hypothetical protein
MKRSDLLVFGPFALLAGFVVVQFLSAPRSHPPAPEVRIVVDSAAVAQRYYNILGTPGQLLAPPAWLAEVHIARLRAAAARLAALGAADAGGVRARDDAAIRARIASLGAHGYIGAMLDQNDSTLDRWPAAANPIRVWVQPRSPEPRFQPGFVPPVRAAFRTWSDLDLGLTFDMVEDSTLADLHVTWARGLPRLGQIGNTLRITDGNGAIVASHIVLATPYDVSTVQNAALHEVGHAIGLDHSPDPGDLMASTTNGRQYRLSTADRNTARLLYSLPGGRVR